VRRRRRNDPNVLLCATVLLLLPGFAFAQQAEDPDEAKPKESLVEALQGGQVAVNLRYRYEFVDQDNFDAKAHASTLRTTLAYRTKAFKGFGIYLQAENVTDVGAGDEHNNLGFGDRSNGVTSRPVIADPPGTEMLQGYLQYQNGGSRSRIRG